MKSIDNRQKKNVLVKRIYSLSKINIQKKGLKSENKLKSKKIK